MIFRRFLTIAPLCTALAAGSALGSDEAVLGAYAAFRSGDPDKLARHASALQGHVLEGAEIAARYEGVDRECEPSDFWSRLRRSN